MEFLSAFRVCASGLAAQRTKMDVIVSNLANIDTTRTPEGGAYKRKVPVFASEPAGGSFDETLRMVRVERIAEDKGSVKMVFDPAHPDANEKGVVEMPDINPLVEMADMLTANRAYEACVTAFDTTKNMALKALELGK
ncbi:MAG: flagellar basal body rod protein FlgC [Deltaproteobacteria bacterium]|nr:flagellar basal body rod protein FlgC [Deltaproteobacteria bacterium]